MLKGSFKKGQSMPTGEHHYNMDSKGRLVIPPSFRDFLHHGLMATRGLEGCLYLFPQDTWEKLEGHLTQLPFTDPTARAFVRFFYSSATPCAPDSQHRLSIPQPLRQFAHLETEVVVAGAPNRLELWNPQRWNQVLSEVQTGKYTSSTPPELLENFIT